jgi:sortase A
MPGEGRLVYIAGHRTTYAAPFAHIDRLRPGDRISLTTPYATFRYAVRDHRIVRSDALEVLRSRGREELVLQACHPRFFATHRYLVDARPISITPRRSQATAVRAATAAGRSPYAEMTTGVPGSART